MKLIAVHKDQKTYDLSLENEEIPTIKGAYRSKVGKAIRDNEDFELDKISDFELLLGDLTPNETPVVGLSEIQIEDIIETLKEFASNSIAAIRTHTRNTATPDHENPEIIRRARLGKEAARLATSIMTEFEVHKFSDGVTVAEPERRLNYESAD